MKTNNEKDKRRLRVSIAQSKSELEKAKQELRAYQDKMRDPELIALSPEEIKEVFIMAGAGVYVSELKIKRIEKTIDKLQVELEKLGEIIEFKDRVFPRDLVCQAWIDFGHTDYDSGITIYELRLSHPDLTGSDWSFDMAFLYSYSEKVREYVEQSTTKDETLRKLSLIVSQMEPYDEVMTDQEAEREHSLSIEDSELFAMTLAERALNRYEENANVKPLATTTSNKKGFG